MPSHRIGSPDTRVQREELTEASPPSVPTLVRLGGQREQSTWGPQPSGTSRVRVIGDACGAGLDSMHGDQHSQDVADRLHRTAMKARRSVKRGRWDGACRSPELEVTRKVNVFPSVWFWSEETLPRHISRFILISQGVTFSEDCFAFLTGG